MIPEELLAENLYLDMMFLNFFLGNSQVEEKKKETGLKRYLQEMNSIQKSVIQDPSADPSTV